MRKINYIGIALCCFLMLGANLIQVTAADESVSAEAISDTLEIKQEEEVKVTFMFKDYRNINKGINAYKATLKYDRNIFEHVSFDSFENKNQWEELRFNEDSGELVAIKKKGSKASEQVVVVTLKVKKGAAPQETRILFHDITASQGIKDIGVSDAKLDIDIIGKQEILPIDPEKPIKPEIPQQEELPKEDTIHTGDSGNIGFWVLCLVGAEAVFVYAYAKKKGIKGNKTAKLLIITVLSTQAVAAVGLSVSAYSGKGELNEDGIVDYRDVRLLEAALIHEEELTASVLKSADMNSDGYLTVTDLSLLVQKVENTLEYKVQLSEIDEQNYYPKKQEDIELCFAADVNYGGVIERVIINEQEYAVKGLGNQIYSVHVGNSNAAGIKEYHFSKVILESGKKVDVDLTITLDILRDVPNIQNYHVDENIKKSSLEIAFDVLDIDKSITKAGIEFYDNKQEILQRGEVRAGHNMFSLPVEEGKHYTASIVIDYDLDSNQLGAHEQDHRGSIHEEKELSFIIDYDFQMKNIKLCDQNGNPTTVFGKTDPIQLHFQSSNAVNLEVEKAVINGNEYTVKKQGAAYVVELAPIQQAGPHRITLESVVLSNGKEFAISKDNSFDAIVLKTAPIIENFAIQEKTDAIDVSFKLLDQDKALEKASVVLFDANGKEVQTKPVKKGEQQLNFQLPMAGKYSVEVVGEYRLAEGQELIKQVLAKGTAEALPTVEIHKLSADRTYYEKSAPAIIRFALTTNKPEALKAVRINHAECEVRKQSDGTYQATYYVSEHSGVQSLEISKAIFTDGLELDLAADVKVEVLKDKPQVTTFRQTDDLNASKVRLDFDVIDNDEAFMKGKAILTKISDGSKQEARITAGANRLTFSVEEDMAYSLQIYATYDRDTDAFHSEDADVNVITNELLREEEVVLVGNYDIKIMELSAYKQNQRTSYFSKNESVRIGFKSSNASSYEPIQAIVNGAVYPLQKENDRYFADVKGFDSAGLKEINVEKIILQHGKELAVNDGNRLQIEILKEKPTVSDFEYEEKENGMVETVFRLNDPDLAYRSGRAVIKDSAGEIVVGTSNLKIGKNTLSFERKAGTYYLDIIADLDLDSNALDTGKHELNNQALLHTEFEIEALDRAIELKDITDVTLYRANRERPSGLIIGYSKVSQGLNVYDIGSSRYIGDFIAKVDMRDLPSFYAPINKTVTRNGMLYLVIEGENLVQYTSDGKKRTTIEVPYGMTYDEGYTADSDSLSVLISKMKQNPNGVFTLTRDYDASELTGNGTALLGDVEFKGTLDGKGHTIRNLNVPLFNELDKATIKNLTLENVRLSNVIPEVGEAVTTKNGALANIVYDGTLIENVHANNVTITTKQAGNGYGGLIGKSQGGLKGNIIQSSSVTNLKITSNGGDQAEGIYVGGLLGAAQATSVLNCYVEGSIYGQSSIGGIIGHVNYVAAGASKIQNSIAKVEIATKQGAASGGGILGVSNGSIILKENVSLAIGHNAKRLFGGGGVQLQGTNIVMESDLQENTEYSISTVAQEDISKATFKSVSFNEQIWNLEECGYDKLPSLKNDDPRNSSFYELEKLGIYIPNFEILKKMEGYDAEKTVMYSNLYRLMPFYDSQYLIKDGNKLDKDHVLNKKIISSVLAFDESGNVMMYLTKENYDDIKTIRIVYEDGTSEDHEVSYKYPNETAQEKAKVTVAKYKIKDLPVEYTYDGFVMKQDATVIDELVEYIQTLEYDKDLKAFINLHDYDKRGYKVLKAYFNEIVRSKEFAYEFVINYLANVDGAVADDNAITRYAITSKIVDSTQFKKQLLAYSYYSRFYGVELNNTSLSDLFMFKGDLFNQNLSFYAISNELYNTRMKSTHTMHLGYRDNLGPLLEIDTQGELVERGVFAVTDYDDANTWFIDYFGSRNILSESAAKNYPEADYRAWTQLKKQSRYLMPILTLPKNSGYMISAPGTFIIGSQMVYVDDVEDQTQIEKLKQDMQMHGDKIAELYNTLLGTIDVSYLNSYADIQIDTTWVKKYGKQESGKASDPFHIHFNDLLNEWFMTSGASAYAEDGIIKFNTEILKNFNTWTHEIGHNQSNKFFFQKNGFRTIGGNGSGNVGTEDYTDGHTSQNVGDGDVNWNLSKNYAPGSMVTTNLTPDRIDSVEKLDNYYKGMFEAIDMLDYIEALAFLELTPEEQAKVAVQIQYGNKENTPTTASVHWKKLSAQDFESMELQTVEDLWDHRITIRPDIGDNGWSQDGSGYYGSEGMYVRRWYQPYNESGRTHSYAFKYNAWQMLGIAGYENGYLNWYTGKSSNDLDAIRKITGDETMTWKRFKQERYEAIAEKMKNSPYMNADDLFNSYLTALKTDAKNNDKKVSASTNVRRANYHYLKRVTDDFYKDIFVEDQATIHIRSAEEFIEKIKSTAMIDEKGVCYYVGNFVLEEDIDLGSIDTDTATTIDGYFMGQLDGNGHTFVNVDKPIFDHVKFANIKNIKIEDANVTVQGDQKGILANVIEYSNLKQIVAKDVILHGEGETGIITGRMALSFAKDIHVTAGTLTARNRSGLIAGYVDGSQIYESSANGEVSGSGNAIGSFVGEAVGKTYISDSYAKGSAKGINDVGGFIGYVKDSTVMNSFSNATADGRDGIASFVGQTVGASKIANNITLVHQLKGYKFDGRTEKDRLSNFENNYENEGNAGISTRERMSDYDFNGKIDIADSEQAAEKEFYMQTLHWSKDIWDFTKLESGGLPKLKNTDPNDNSFAVKTHFIATAEEFVNLVNQNPYDRFVLTADIEVSDNSSLITNEFHGVLDGNGHKLIGNQTAIFHTLNKATVKNLVIENSNIVLHDANVGTLARAAKNTVIENVHVVSAAIHANTDCVGGLVGIAQATTIKESSSDVNISSDGENIGGLVGRVEENSLIENSYSSGMVEGKRNVGGLLGNVAASTIRKNYSVAAANAVQAGAGFVGITFEEAKIEDNISLGNRYSQYKFDAATKADQFQGFRNNYEFEGNLGISTLSRKGIDFSGKIKSIDEKTVTSVSFYTKELGWSSDIWDFSGVSEERTPILKKSAVAKAERFSVHEETITTVDQFVSQLTKYPNGKFIIAEDLDFKYKEYAIGSVVIPGTFNGIILGQGHTIKNLNNATIFEQFNGSVEQLNLDKFDYGVVYKAYPGYTQYIEPGASDRSQSMVAAFAKESLNANYEDMKLSRISMVGKSNVATLVAKDRYSSLKNIDVHQAYVYARSDNKGMESFSSAFIGQKLGGSMENIYVHGDLIVSDERNGGILGKAENGVDMNKVIANIYMAGGTDDTQSKNGMFAGIIDLSVTIRNSAAIGATPNNTKVHHFIGEHQGLDMVENCYEIASLSGTSDADGSHIQGMDRASMKTKDFYVNTLHFDEAVWQLDTIEERRYTEGINLYGPKPENFPMMLFFGLK